MRKHKTSQATNIKLILLSVLVFALAACNGSNNSPSVSTPGNDTTESTPESQSGWSSTKFIGVAGKVVTGAKIAPDLNGNLYVAGKSTGGLDGNTLTGTQDMFLTKLSSAGTSLWTRQLGAAAASTQAQAVAVDSSGNILVFGSSTGGISGNTLIGSVDAVLVKYDSNGNILWARQVGVAAANTMGISVNVDSDNNIYIVGHTNGNLHGITKTGSQDLYISKWDSDGNRLWTKLLGEPSRTVYAVDICIDSSKDAYVTYYGDSLVITGTTAVGIRDLYVSKYETDGTLSWTRNIGAPGSHATPTAIHCDNSDNIYAAAWTYGGVDGNTLTGSRDAVVVKYSSSGNKAWTLQFGATSASISPDSIHSDSQGNVYMFGPTNVGLDGNTKTGTQDAFLIKLTSAGNRQWTRQVGGATATTIPTSVRVNADDEIFVAGYVSVNFDGMTVPGVQSCFVTKYDASGIKQ